MGLNASEIMTREVYCVSAEMLASQAWTFMHRARIRHLPVTFEHRLIGVLSDRDLLPLMHREANGTLTLRHDCRVDEVMTRAPTTCEPRVQVSRLAEIMITKKIDSVPIVSGDELVGLVTSTDLLELLMKPEEPVAKILPFDFSLRHITGAGAAA